MSRMPRSVRITLGVSVALLAAYAILWSTVTQLEIGRSDFTSTYVGGLLLRQGHPGELYDLTAQSQLHAQLIAPDTEGNLPFVDAPLAAALAAPVTLLGLDLAYRLWGLLQLAVLTLAVGIAAWSAPWPSRTPRVWKAAVALVALGGAGTLVELLQAQWGSVLALGLALAYRDWKHGRHLRGGMWLILCAGIAKPHLALGLFAFILGWRNRQVLIGALGAGLAVVILSVLVAGPAGPLKFVELSITSNTQWQLSTFSSFVGIPGSFLGNAGAAQIIGAIGDLIALGVAASLGAMVRSLPARLDVALAGAAALSILASPHAGIHDLVMLAPAMAWCTALAVAHAWEVQGLGRWRGPLLPVGLWLLLTCAAFVSLGDGGASPPFQLVPWALIGAAAVTWVVSRNQMEPVADPLPGGRGGAVAYAP